jgi:hypothetical protein
MRLAAATLAAGLLVASSSVLGEELPPLPGAGATIERADRRVRRRDPHLRHLRAA